MRFEPGAKLVRSKRFAEYLNGKFIAPINVEFSPSGKCNAKCNWCFYRQKSGAIPGLDRKLFKINRMEGLIEELAGLGVKSISWTGGGEPTLHPDFSKFTEWVNWTGLEQGLFTNALDKIKYDASLFEWIRVSKTNQDWNEENLRELRKCKTLGMCLNYRGNIDEENIKETLKIAEKINATYVQVRPALNILGDKTKTEVPLMEHSLLKITDYKFMGSNEDRHYQQCEAFHFTPFIWQDGDVDICGYHRKDTRFNLGNLYNKGKEGKFRQIMQNSPKSIPIVEDCQICCKLNSMNNQISVSKNLQDINFP